MNKNTIDKNTIDENTIDLFKPYKIRNLELKNRFVRSATWDGTADEQGGATEKSLSIYKTLAAGNIGLIIIKIYFNVLEDLLDQ